MYIPFGLPQINYEEKKALVKLLSQPILAHGNKTKKFEHLFKKFTKAKFTTSVSSCTAGMHLFYLAIGLKKNDEVLLPAQTHVATAHAIEAVGAKPVFIDVDILSGNIDINKIEKKINKNTRVITVVHFAGIPVDMEKIIELAKKYKLFVLEDCALSLGAQIKNIHTGLWGDAGVFSFYPVKHITTGEGGMIISKNLKLAKKINLLKSLGINKNFLDRKTPGLYNCNSFGLNYRMSEINSVLGIEQMKKLNLILKKRKNNFNYYKSYLKKSKNIFLLGSNIEKKKLSSHYCAVLIFVNKKIFNLRSKILNYLKKKKIGTSIYYPYPVPMMNYYKKKYSYKTKQFSVAEKISYNSIALPTGPHINKEKIKFILVNLEKIISKLLK